VAFRLALASLVLVGVFTTGSTAAAVPDSTEQRMRAVDRLLRADSLGLVAISGGSERGAFAAPVRRERGVWKVEIDPTFTVEAVRPLPGDRVLRRTQLFAEIAAPHMIDGAIMWFDGLPFETRQYWSPDQKHMSIWGEAPQPLRAGRHTVVAFAGTRREAAANAWTFSVRR
jgi:hypothetical protein